MNNKQIDAVLFDDNAVVMACPGSGKTRTIAYKIAYKLSSMDDDRYVIAITYTNNAADEIKRRVSDMGISVERLWIGTIHSFCLKWILKPYSSLCEHIRYGYHIIDPHDSESLKKKFCADYECNYFHTDFGWCETGLREKSYRKKAVNEYYEFLKENGCIDFDQIIYLSYVLVKNHCSVSRNLSNIFNLILVDEYQDTQILQYELLFLLLKVNSNTTRLFFVGDPNQAIFNSMGGVALSFDGFNSRSGKKFHLLELKDNYRSSQGIVNYFSLFKTVEGRPFEAAGELKEYTSIITFNNDFLVRDLDSNIKELITSALSEGISQNEICIIAPWWYHLSEITRRLMAIMPDVKFNGPGVTPISLNRDTLWYKLARIALTNPSPKNYGSRLFYATEIFSQLQEAGFSLLSECGDARKFLKHCNSLGNNEVDGIEYLKGFFESSLDYFPFDINNHDEFKSSYDAFFASAQARKEKLLAEKLGILTTTEHYKKMFDKRDGITVSTVHSVKGLEFDCVIAFGLLQGIVPRFDEDDSQSKRLLYVISSRARKRLHLISESNRSHKGGTYRVTNALSVLKFKYTNMI